MASSPSLPDSVSLSDPDDAPVSLPPSVQGDEKPETKCCKRKCKTAFSPEFVEQYRFNTLRNSTIGGEVHHDLVYNLVLQAMRDSRGGRLTYMLQSKPVCRNFWLHCHCIGHDTIMHMLKCGRRGHPKLPSKAPPGPRVKTVFYEADAWLLNLYKNFAEPFATPDWEEGVKSKETEIEHEVIQDINHPLYSLSVCVRGGQRESSSSAAAAHLQRTIPKRYLNFETYRELWSYYEADTTIVERVSKSSFLACYKANWQRVMPLHPGKTHSKCNTCAVLAEERLQAMSKQDVADVDARKAHHINICMADRAVNMRGNKLAARFENFSSPGPESLVKLTIDGMDQAKCLLPRPRKLLGTSSWAQLWKPAQHLTGIIIWGQMEIFYLLPPDCKKDANMNSYLVARSFEILQKKKPALKLPPNLIVASDNTTRESKNQWFAGFCCVLAATTFTSLEVQFLQSGHTHSEIDQRFSAVAKSIQSAETLETPHDLANHIQTNLKPMQNREIYVEVVQNTLDFQRWLFAANVNLTGLVPTVKEQFANHVWRFVRRKSLQQQQVVNNHAEWKLLEPAADDICMVVKQYMSSPNPSQEPFLAMPKTVVDQLDPKRLQPSQRNQWNETTLKEFRKTAQAVAALPWQLVRAKDYLDKICRENEAGLVNDPIPLKSFMQRRDPSPEAQVQAPEPPDAPDPPRRIQAVMPTGQEERNRAKKLGHGLKRPASVLKRPASTVHIRKRPASGV
eukprot:s3646_g2.t1